jgi:hypothetical protein
MAIKLRKKMMKKFMYKWFWGVPAALLIPACVTINIYFPAAAAEKAADKIIDEVWQLKKAQEQGQDKAAEPAVKPATQPEAK